jgi:multicomponent Na+:H+ antiporter subunit E
MWAQLQEQSMIKKLLSQQKRMWYFLLVNLLSAVIIPIFLTLFGAAWDHFLSFLVVAALLALIDRPYGRYLFWSFRFLLFIVRDIIVSNLALAWLVIQPRLKLDPGIVAVPLTVNTDIEITVLASAVSLPPGTLAVDLHTVETGVGQKNEYILYVHAFHVGDPEKVRASIKNGIERMILHISRGATE